MYIPEIQILAPSANTQRYVVSSNSGDNDTQTHFLVSCQTTFITCARNPNMSKEILLHIPLQFE